MLKLNFLLLLLILTGLSAGHAKSSTPLADEAFDGGVISAESLGRGNTSSSNMGHAGSGSENPAGLRSHSQPALYSTAFVGETSDISKSTTSKLDPLENKVLQYISVNSEKGVLFYEPIGRTQEITILDSNNPSTDFQEVAFSANAIGFAGSHELRHGVFGLSIAYLRGSISQSIHRIGQQTTTVSDTGDGFRTNFGYQIPTGPFMWGLELRNAPAFIFWKHFRRDILPFTVKLGNTYRLQGQALFTVEGETRYYNEGSNKEDFIRFAYESLYADSLVFRLGFFTNDLDKSENHHYTFGTTFKTSTGVKITYALERFDIQEEKVVKSYLSITLPFIGDEVNER